MRLRRALFGVAHATGRALDGLASLCSALGVGVLSIRGLERAIRREWDDLSGAEPEDRRDQGLEDWEEAFYLRHLRRHDRILLVGCGTGRELLVLGARGYRVQGLDVSPRATAIAARAARERGLVVPVLTGPVETATIPAPVDAVVFCNQVYSLIPRSAARAEVLRRLTGILAPRGRILLTYVPQRVDRWSWACAATALASSLARGGWRAAQGDVIQGSGPDALYYEHRFRRDEVEVEGRAAGLGVVHHEVGRVGMVVLRRTRDG